MRQIVTGLVGLFLLSQIATARARKDSVQRYANDEVSFELVSGYLVVVDGSIGPLHGLKFVLDTGATHSAVSSKVADQLDLQRLTGKVFNIDKTVKTEWAAIPEVEFGPIRASQVPVMITNLDYFKSLASHVDAVMGLDLLRQNNFSIDFADKKVRFGQVETGRHSTPMVSDDISLKVEAEVDGTLIHLILDSGAPGPLMYEERLENRAVDYRIEEENYGYRINGILRLTRARVRRLQLGGRDIEHTVFLTHSPAERIMDGIDGLLGLTALKARRINFDFKTNTLSWTN
jgi:gag-polyprotein putative aspartyl protease